MHGPRSLSGSITIRTLFLIGSVWAAACDDSSTPTSPSPGGAPVMLAAGQVATVPGTPLTLSFMSVPSDSRCPADAVCIHLGEAVARLNGTLPSQGSTSFELRTAESGRVAQVGKYRIELVSLEPYPFSSDPIEPHEYRVTLRVDTP
jgi:hypothetical protein